MSTFLTFTTTDTEMKVHVYPPLTGVKEIQLLDFNVGSKSTFYLCCDIIDSHYSYTNFRCEDPTVTKIYLSNLLAVIPSENYPSIPIKHHNGTSLPINSFTLSIFDENGGTANFSDTIRISLKITH